METEYNGWSNWQTWNLNLWAMNDERSYRYIMANRPFNLGKTRRIARELFPDGTPDMVNRNHGPCKMGKVAWREIMDAWNEK